MILNRIKYFDLIHGLKFSINTRSLLHTNSIILKEDKDKEIESSIDLSSKIKIKDLDWISTKIKSNKTKTYKKESISKIDKRDNKDKWARINKSELLTNNYNGEEEMEIPHWKRRKQELADKFNGEHWRPTKRLSRTAMERIRFLAKELPQDWPLPRISEEFKISVEAVRRILKSKFQPTQSVIEHQEGKRKEKRIEFLKSLKQNEKEKEKETNNITEKRLNKTVKPRMKQVPLQGHNEGWDKL